MKNFNSVLFRYHLKQILVLVLSPFVVTFPLILKMNTGIYGSFFGTDIRGGLWNLWWHKFSLTHHLDLAHCPFLVAPFGMDLSEGPLSWFVKALFSGLLSFVSPVASLNILMLASFILAGLFTYFFCFWLTKDRNASLVGALIFNFSPFFLNKAMEFGFFFLGNWFVLFIWAILFLQEKIILKRILFAVISFWLLLSFNVYYAFFALIFTLSLFAYNFIYEWKIKIYLLKIKLLGDRFKQGVLFFTSTMLVFVGAALMNFSLVIKFFKILFPFSPEGVKPACIYVRSFDYLASQSARPLSYFLPASTHPVFGDFTKKMFGTMLYGRGSIEQTLYIGLIPLVLAFFSIRMWLKRKGYARNSLGASAKRDNYYIGLFLFCACAAFFCSMPPVVDLVFFKLYFPSYYLYKILPMFRAYARFGIVVVLCVGVLAAYGLKFIFLKQRKNNRLKMLIYFIIMSAICFEFMNVPPLRVTDISGAPDVYLWLSEQEGDFSVAEYPMALASSGEAQDNYDYLFYQTKHQKRLINGAVEGTDAFEIKKQIIRVDDESTPAILSAMGVKYIIFHKSLYKKGEYRLAVDVFGSVPDMRNHAGYRLIKDYGDDVVYEVVAAACPVENLKIKQKVTQK
ncbi:MAG: hypothetical protein ABIC68_00860 [Candidatus Omnitrophota bacterium]